VREHLDVGENPPNGVIVYYWLAMTSGPVTLTFRQAEGAAIVTFGSDDEARPSARRPGVRRGLNRFVWDMKHPGPVRIDPPWATLKNKPLANEPEPQSGPTVVPGEYLVELTAGFETRSAAFSIVKDPRLATSPDDYAKQFALLKELYDKLSTLNGAVNHIRLVRRQLFALTELLGDHHDALVAAAKSACERLTAIESVLIDIRRESPRDTLRHPAGLNDTLIDMINTAAIADMARQRQRLPGPSMANLNVAEHGYRQHQSDGSRKFDRHPGSDRATARRRLLKSGHIKKVDFIEQWFGVSPDTDGSPELLWIVVIVLSYGDAPAPVLVGLGRHAIAEVPTLRAVRGAFLQDADASFSTKRPSGGILARPMLGSRRGLAGRLGAVASCYVGHSHRLQTSRSPRALVEHRRHMLRAAPTTVTSGAGLATKPHIPALAASRPLWRAIAGRLPRRCPARSAFSGAPMSR
jgi:hypothetical protein